MTDERYNNLMNNDNLSLTDEEIKEGWHFCAGWDGLLVGPGTEELQSCQCVE